jgi:lipopolysaccharide export system protein LptA
MGETGGIFYTMRTCAAFALLALVIAISLRGQPTFSGKVSGGFQAPTSTDSDGRRHVVRGQEVESRGNGVLDLTQPRVTRYNADDSEDMFIESARCIYDTKVGVAYSTTNLSVRTADSRFAIQGVGWKWDLSGSVLTISNQIAAQVQKATLAGTASNTNRATNQTVQITSRQFQQDGDSASFIGGVLVKDGADTLRCERLNIQFIKPGGAQRIEAIENVDLLQADTRIQSGRALYDVKENTIRISEGPAWSANQREGSAGVLLIDRNTDTLKADGRVYMKLPLTNLVLSAESTQTNAQNRFVEIRSDHFDFLSARTNRASEAVYHGNVRATQADAALTCQRLVASFGSSNRLTRLKAIDQVQITSPKNVVSGQEADYDLESDKMTILGAPRWKIDQMTGRSERLVFFTRTKEVLALQNVEMIVPGRSFGGIFAIDNATNDVPTTNSSLKITAESLAHSEKISVFQKDVVVADERGTIQCGLLTLVGGESNQVRRIIAERDVVVKQPDLVAFGDRAEYDQPTGLVRLTGNPELHAPDKQLRADMFIIDRNKNTFSVSPGRYRIQLQQNKKTETASGANDQR